MGTPFNSTADDFGFYRYPNKQVGFLTSNRAGGKGGDDIYCWQGVFEVTPTPKLAQQKFCVSDAQSGTLITDATVNIQNTATDMGSSNV